LIIVELLQKLKFLICTQNARLNLSWWHYFKRCMDGYYVKL